MYLPVVVMYLAAIHLQVTVTDTYSYPTKEACSIRAGEIVGQSRTMLELTGLGSNVKIKTHCVKQ